jgi:hypothetical protein
MPNDGSKTPTIAVWAIREPNGHLPAVVAFLWLSRRNRGYILPLSFTVD